MSWQSTVKCDTSAFSDFSGAIFAWHQPLNSTQKKINSEVFSKFIVGVFSLGNGQYLQGEKYYSSFANCVLDIIKLTKPKLTSTVAAPKTFHSRKCIWRNRMWNSGNFVQGRKVDK